MATKEERRSRKSAKQIKKEIENIYSNPNAPIWQNIKEIKRKKIKRRLTASAIALTAGAVFVAPAVIYFKRNDEYDITIESSAENFVAYKITLKKGSLISHLKQKLNVFNGHNLVGIYKDEACTIPFSDSDEVKKSTQVFLKYEKIKYTVSFPKSEAFEIEHSTAVDTNEIEWGENFNFRINLNEDYSKSEVKVYSNGQEILPDENGWYIIEFVDENVVITVGGVKINELTLGEIPEQVKVTRSNGEEITANTKLEYGETLTITYTATENHTMSEFRINGEIFNGGEYVVTDDVEIIYSEFENTSLLTFEENESGWSVL